MSDYVIPFCVFSVIFAAIDGAVAYKYNWNVWLGVLFGALGMVLTLVVYEIIGPRPPRKKENEIKQELQIIEKLDKIQATLDEFKERIDHKELTKNNQNVKL